MQLTFLDQNLNKEFKFENISSDAIDIDFSNGQREAIDFKNINNDAIDFSGSTAKLDMQTLKMCRIN